MKTLLQFYGSPPLMSTRGPHATRASSQRARHGAAGIALFEGLLYARPLELGWRRGLLLGFLVNAFSYGIGLVLYRTGVL